MIRLREVEPLLRATPEKSRSAMLCALVGHSSVVNVCLGQVTCARCDAILGDSLFGAYDLESKVLMRHSCGVCRTNYRKLGWRDKLLTPNPFD